jgi:hypothetical protein
VNNRKVELCTLGTFPGDERPVSVNLNGRITKNVVLAFTNGNCHSLALAINELTGYPIYGLVTEFDRNYLDGYPGHFAVKTPAGFLDIKGLNAVERRERRNGPITLVRYSPNDIREMSKPDTGIGYIKLHPGLAKPFALNLLKKYRLLPSVQGQLPSVQPSVRGSEGSRKRG